MPQISSLAEDFARIFAGLDRSSGRYVVPNDAKRDAKGKVLGRAWTAHAPITLALWEAHLTGNKQTTVTDEETNEPITGALGLGVVPIRDDATCVFGAIDIDQYDPPVDYNILQKNIAELNLPVIVCRSKSGAPHVYLFLSTPAPAALVRERLTEWAIALGYPGVEVFPKQVLLTKHSEGDWLNIPFAGGNRSTRYALKPDGKAMTVEEFVVAVGEAAISPFELEAFEVPVSDETEEGDFNDGPPCLQTLAKIGFGDWQNNGLFNLAVYEKMVGEGWESRVEALNRDLMSPPLGHREVAAIVKSVKKKSYFYKCKDQPIVAVCNRALCLKRKFGVGSGSGDSGVAFGEMRRIETDPVIWLWSIDAAEIELTTEQLMDQRRFRTAVIEKLSKWPNPVKQDEWEKMVKARLASAVSIGVPGDATRGGQFWAQLANFCTGRARGKAFDDLLRGVAFTDIEKQRVYFRSTDLFAYLGTHRFSATERDIWRWMREKGAEHHESRIKGKLIDYWSVPAFPEQTEEHAVPRVKQTEM